MAAEEEAELLAEKKDQKIIMKFGGSSLATAERIREVSQIVSDQRSVNGHNAAVVCSAMGKTTNALLAAGDSAMNDGIVCMDSIRTNHLATCDELEVSEATRAEVIDLLDDLGRLLEGISYLKELTPRTKDLLVSYGERMSVRLVASCLNSMGVPAQPFDSWTLGLKTNSEFGNAEIDDTSYGTLKQKLSVLDDETVPVITGFIAHDPDGHVTTLGRGGSDLSAAVIAAACELDEIQVWKDVDGMLTADPRIIPSAVPVPAVTFEEASELAYFGAKILHPISMLPAMRANIPVRVKNSYNPNHPGTVISGRAAGRSRDRLVTAITTKSQQTVLDIVSTRMLGQSGFLESLFRVFKDRSLSIDCIATSEVSVSLTLDGRQKGLQGDDMGGVLTDLREYADVEVHTERSIVALIADVAQSSNVLARVFVVLAREGIQVDMLSQGASKVNISLIVKDEDLSRCLAALHYHFFECEGEECDIPSEAQ